MEIIAVDFDGTIVEHAFPQIGKPIPFAIETLLKLQKEGYRLVLWTVRTGKKIAADIYIDDRNLGGLPDWGVIYSIIKGKTTPTYNVEYTQPKPKGFIEKIRGLFY